MGEIDWATADDLNALAALITHENQTPSRRCMHSGTTLAANQKSLGELKPPLQRSALVSRTHRQLTAAIVCDGQVSDGKGYLLGPFAIQGADHLRAELLDEVLVRVSLPRLFAYSHVENQSNRGLYTSRGFVEGLPASVYRLHATRADESRRVEDCHALLASEFESFAELHACLFPNTYFSASKLAELPHPHRLFVVSEGEQVLGYVHASNDDEPEAGYIHYLGVQDAYRRRGIGRRLMSRAIVWLFSECGYSSIALNLSSRHGEARALYESLGFELEATGVGARLERESE